MQKKLLYILLAFILVACGATSEKPDSASVYPDKQMHRSEKRGVAFGFARLDDAMLLSPSISWFYNWGPDFRVVDLDTWFALDSVVFFPMAWNGGFDANRIKTYLTAHPQCLYLLAYNEPNLNDQAHMTPAAAAANWPQLKAIATEYNLKIVSPAMNYGTLEGYHDPIKWLDEFFGLVPLSDIDAIAVHCYMSSVSALESYIGMFAKYGKPVWLTEFCAWDPVPGNIEVQLNYMCAAVNMLEQNQLVERYAWFIPRTNGAVDSAPFMQLLTHTSPSELTEAGKIYTSLSSFDKTVWLDASKQIGAEMYTGLSDYSIQIRTYNGKDSMLIKNLTENQWVEYQIFIPKGASEVQLCYATPVTCSVAYYIDGEIAGFAEMPRSENGMDDWQVSSAEVSLPEGRHTLRVLVGRGSFNMKWIKTN